MLFGVRALLGVVMVRVADVGERAVVVEITRDVVAVGMYLGSGPGSRSCGCKTSSSLTCGDAVREGRRDDVRDDGREDVRDDGREDGALAVVRELERERERGGGVRATYGR